jgi:hypothetical protein
VLPTARLREGAPGRWTVEAALVVEAGQLQLDRLAAGAAAFEASAIRVA